MVKASRSSLGKRPSSVLGSSPPSSPTPLHKRVKTGASVVILADGSYANKENIPPVAESASRDAPARSLHARTARQSNFGRRDSSIGGTVCGHTKSRALTPIFRRTSG